VAQAEIIVSEEAQGDLKELAEEDTDLVREALRLMVRLEGEPYSGDRLRHKSNRKPLAKADCRKIKFDLPRRPPASGKRYRILYRLEPHEGSPDRIYVIAVREKRAAYDAGTARAAKRLRELASKRARNRPERR
jgi:mRNA-degrading endonuclease RelE of RelBE toxin-antitoxin system